mgnify:FL=1
MCSSDLAFPGVVPGALQVVPVVGDALSRRAPVGGRALELVDLADVASGAAFTVSGHLHNPADAPLREQVSAVVRLEDGAGRTIGSGRSNVAAQLAPGATASFVVMLEATRPAAHYRVSFRERERVLPHIDLRNPVRGDRRDGEKLDSQAATPVEHVENVEKTS